MAYTTVHFNMRASKEDIIKCDKEGLYIMTAHGKLNITATDKQLDTIVFAIQTWLQDKDLGA